ncbi:MAG: STAS domain-containing protein [Planctomycetota bacterium]|nr:STAS domain-containing protein [Planctomycetota bacterium]
MSSADDQLKVFAVGKRTVLGFGGQEILSQLNVSVYRDHLVSLIEEHDIETVAFDLTGIALVPSGMLGLLASLREHNVSVEVYNPSDDVNDVLTITRLNELMTIKQGNPLDEPEPESEDSDGE